MLINIRYNTECKDDRLYWRVLIDGAEHLAEKVHIKVASFTSQDFLLGKNVFKHHISCIASKIEWEGATIFIT